MLHHAAIVGALTVFPFAGTVIAASSPDTGIAPYISGGANVVLAGGLAEVTRRLLNGRLIPRETRDAEAETAAYIVAAGQREDRAMKVVEDANRLAMQTAADVKLHNATLTADLGDRMDRLARAVEDMRDEIRRDRR